MVSGRVQQDPIEIEKKDVHACRESIKDGAGLVNLGGRKTLQGKRTAPFGIAQDKAPRPFESATSIGFPFRLSWRISRDAPGAWGTIPNRRPAPPDRAAH